MLRLGIRLLQRLARELGWIHHYHSSHGLTSLKDLYLCYIGFVPDTYTAYDLDSNDYRQYISDKTRFFGLPRTHGEYMALLRDKSLFYASLNQAGFASHLPQRHAYLPPRQLGELSLDDGRYILKPLRGSGGQDVYVLHAHDGTLEIEGNRDRLEKQLHEQQFVLEDKIENADYARDIFDDSLNTIRLYTAWDYDRDEPFLARAYHRFGTAASAPADNHARGGIDAPIDMESGRLGSAYMTNDEGHLEVSDVHPETGAQVRGVTIEKWPQLKALILDAASHLKNNAFIGWDGVVDAEGHVLIIEANPTPSLKSAQHEGPLMNDPRVEAFLDHYALP